MKRKVLVVLAMCLVIFGVVGTVNALTIDLNAKNNALNNPISIQFDAGTYDITPKSIQDGGLYTAWSARYGNPNTWVHRYSYSSTEFGAINIGGIGSGPYYANANAAFEHAISTTFTLEHSGIVNFYVWDGPNGYDYAYDNVGGISISVNKRATTPSVPEPATLLLFGIGIAGLAGIRIRRRNE